LNHPPSVRRYTGNACRPLSGPANSGRDIAMPVRLPGRERTRTARATVIAVAGLAGAVCASAVPAGASTRAPAVTDHIRTQSNQHDPTYNQLLDINNFNKIAGFFGSGAQGHPSKGYRLVPPYRQANYQGENAPGSRQTKVSGLNDHKVSVGFSTTTNRVDPDKNVYTGFWAKGGHFHKVIFPLSMELVATVPAAATPQTNELLAINNHGQAVGFFRNTLGNDFPYLYNIATAKFRALSALLGSPDTSEVTGINDKNKVVGFRSDSGQPVSAFLLNLTTRHVTTLKAPGADTTEAFGINNHGEVVGAYQIGTSVFGFTWTAAGGFRTVTEPHGPLFTVISGVNDAGDLVGAYLGAQGHINGFLAKP
jgi:hypothetical protein